MYAVSLYEPMLNGVNKQDKYLYSFNFFKCLNQCLSQEVCFVSIRIYVG